MYPRIESSEKTLLSCWMAVVACFQGLTCASYFCVWEKGIKGGGNGTVKSVRGFGLENVVSGGWEALKNARESQDMVLLPAELHPDSDSSFSDVDGDVFENNSNGLSPVAEHQDSTTDSVSLGKLKPPPRLSKRSSSKESTVSDNTIVGVQTTQFDRRPRPGACTGNRNLHVFAPGVYQRGSVDLFSHS